MIKRHVIAALPLLFLLALGCGGSKGLGSSVSGKVTYNNQPVTAGMIYFYPAEGAASQVGILSDGTYTFTDLPPGDYTVVVDTESANQNRNMPTYGGNRGGGGDAKGGQKPAPGGMSPRPEGAGGGGAYVKIPDKFAKKESSTLKTTVGKGKNTYDVTMAD